MNPVLREGNSDRRAPASVKEYARNHSTPMGAWTKDSRTNVATMSRGNFRSTEKSAVMAADGTYGSSSGDDGTTTVLRESVPVLAGEIVDASVMSAAALREFLNEQIDRSRNEGVLFSLQVKATMMRISDPIIFGHAVQAYFPGLFADYGDALAAVGGDPDEGLGAILQAAQKLPGRPAFRGGS